MQNKQQTLFEICPTHSKPWMYLCAPDYSKKIDTKFMCQDCKSENRKKLSRTEILDLQETRNKIIQQWGGIHSKGKQVKEQIQQFYNQLTQKLNQAIVEDKALTLKLLRRLGALQLPNNIKTETFLNFINNQWEDVDGKSVRLLLETQNNNKNKPKQQQILNNIKNELNKLNEKVTSLRYLLLAKKIQTDFLIPIREGDSKIATINQFTRIGGIFNSRNKMIRTMKLIYRGSDNQFKPEKFIENCSEVSQCIVIVKTQNNKIIGGYSDLPLTSKIPQQIVQDIHHTTFIMNLNTIRTYSMLGSRALQYSKQSIGPIFGQDLKIDSTVTSNIGNYYQTPDGVKPGSFEAKFNFLNAQGSKLIQLEVWRIAF